MLIVFDLAPKRIVNVGHALWQMWGKSWVYVRSAFQGNPQPQDAQTVTG